MTTSRLYGVPPMDSNLLTKTPLMIQYKKEIDTTSQVGRQKKIILRTEAFVSAESELM